MTPHEIAPEPADPFLWLEEVADPRALEWAADQTDRTNETFAGTTRSALEERLTRILDDPDRLVVPGRHGDLMYDLWRDADNPRGLWRRTSRAVFTAGSPEWQVLLDIDALGRDEGRAWSFAGATHGPAGSDRALVRL
ncbi:MAG TPA: S9 family peptidase, partial [Microbacterium sp.]|nr:S9 family peptidase [Microbacterium sp.]